MHLGQSNIGLTEGSMRLTFIAIAGLLCAAIWLALLALTDFSVPVVGGGLLSMLALTGRVR
jgi:hypothetical protein